MSRTNLGSCVLPIIVSPGQSGGYYGLVSVTPPRPPPQRFLVCALQATHIYGLSSYLAWTFARSRSRHQSKMEMFRSKMAKRRSSWIGKIWSFRICFAFGCRVLQTLQYCTSDFWHHVIQDGHHGSHLVRNLLCAMGRFGDGLNSPCMIVLKFYMGHG